ncbi:hypothetical protein AAMO2058_001196100 [Amorphochlora amoebiformis]
MRNMHWFRDDIPKAKTYAFSVCITFIWVLTYIQFKCEEKKCFLKSGKTLNDEQLLKNNLKMFLGDDDRIESAHRVITEMAQTPPHRKIRNCKKAEPYTNNEETQAKESYKRSEGINVDFGDYEAPKWEDSRMWNLTFPRRQSSPDPTDTSVAAERFPELPPECFPEYYEGNTIVDSLTTNFTKMREKILDPMKKKKRRKKKNATNPLSPDEIKSQRMAMGLYCKMCDMTVTRKVELEEHKRGRRHKSRIKMYCAACSKLFGAVQELKMHLKSSEHRRHTSSKDSSTSSIPKKKRKLS